MSFRNLLLSSILLGLMAVPFASPSSVVLPLPPRSADAPTGEQLRDALAPLSLQAREEAILAEVLAGNVPPSLRALVPVTATATINSVSRTAVFHVAPEYLALGSDADFFLMPMSPLLAQRIADRLGCGLPTRLMVNAIWSAAPVKLSPSPIPPSSQMTTVPVFWDHNATVRGQRATSLPAHPLGALVGGHKKDVVVTPRLATQPGKVAIFGWHYLSGEPIQPLSLVHEDTYADYSHGIRLVGSTMTVDGVETTVATVLADPALHVLLSDEGAFSSSRYPVPLPAPDNRVENGSFEGAFADGVGEGWTRWKTSASAAIAYGRASVNKVDGSYSQYWRRTDTTPFDGGVYQRVNVEAGRRYRVGAWLKRQSLFAGTFLRFGFDPTGGTEGAAASVQYLDLAGDANDVWVQYAATVRATGPAITLFARAGHTGTTGATNAHFYLDHVTMIEDDDDPEEPASMGWTVR